MDIREGKRDKEQKIALLKLIWGVTVMLAGILGIVGAIKGIILLLVIGAAMDIMDSLFMIESGGPIASILFSFIGILICFFCFQAPWWYGMCAGLCCEACLSGILGYSMRLSKFLSETKGSLNKRIKIYIKRLLEAL